MRFFIERNSVLNLLILLGGAALGIWVSPWFFLMWIPVQLVDDIAHYCFGRSIFDSEIRIQRGYQFGDLFLTAITGDGRDLGFNLYNGDLSKERKQAQIDKWNFMLKELNLSPGDSLIDIGCGYGDWLNYAKSKGILVKGVNLSPEQAAVARELYGIDVVCANWKEIDQNPLLREELYGKYDAVTFMDTIEHFVSAKDRKKIDVQNQIYSAMFDLAFKLMKPNSRSSKIFLSCLHLKSDAPKSTLRSDLLLYLLDKYHSGCYPTGDEGITKNAVSCFTELKRYDKTEDYRITSVLDKKHFGGLKVQWSFKNALHIPLLVLLDPHHIHKWIDTWCDGWMQWHFGDRAWDRTYGEEIQKKNRRVTLWWIVLEKAKIAKALPSDF